MATQTLDTIDYYPEKVNPKPETNKNHFRIYDNLMCPFAERARLALLSKDIEFQLCEINMFDKAEWHTSFNGGLVPILETQDGIMVPESGIIADWAEDLEPNKGYKLYPADPLAKAQMKADIVNFTKFVPLFYGAVFAEGLNEEKN